MIGLVFILVVIQRVKCAKENWIWELSSVWKRIEYENFQVRERCIISIFSNLFQFVSSFFSCFSLQILLYPLILDHTVQDVRNILIDQDLGVSKSPFHNGSRLSNRSICDDIHDSRFIHHETIGDVDLKIPWQRGSQIHLHTKVNFEFITVYGSRWVVRFVSLHYAQIPLL